MKRVVMISAKQGGGKTTLANDIAFLLKTTPYRPKILKFAHPLYLLHNKIYEILEGFGHTSQKIDGTMMQFLGEHLRERFHEDIWVDIVKQAIGLELTTSQSTVVIDDLRYPNEVRAWRRSETCLVRLECPEELRKKRAEKWRPFVNHSSEVSLDDYTDWDLKFDTSKPHTLENARKIVEWMNLKSNS